eukprot:Colp12_sorted_trinity150504_noHs@7588
MPQFPGITARQMHSIRDLGYGYSVNSIQRSSLILNSGACSWNWFTRRDADHNETPMFNITRRARRSSEEEGGEEEMIGMEGMPMPQAMSSTSVELLPEEVAGPDLRYGLNLNAEDHTEKTDSQLARSNAHFKHCYKRFGGDIDVIVACMRCLRCQDDGPYYDPFSKHMLSMMYLEEEDIALSKRRELFPNCCPAVSA